MHWHRRTLAVAGSLLVAAVCAIAAYGATATHKDTVNISFMEAMASGTQKPSLDLLTKRFERLHPNINVTLIAEPNYGILLQKEQAAVAAGQPPTIGQAYENWAASFANSKAIIPLTGYVNNKQIGVKPADQKQIWKGVWKDLFLPDGKIWMWPFNKSDYVMYYNADKLAKAGLQVPKTWVQFATVAKALTKNGNWAWNRHRHARRPRGRDDRDDGAHPCVRRGLDRERQADPEHEGGDQGARLPGRPEEVGRSADRHELPG